MVFQKPKPGRNAAECTAAGGGAPTSRSHEAAAVRWRSAGAAVPAERAPAALGIARGGRVGPDWVQPAGFRGAAPSSGGGFGFFFCGRSRASSVAVSTPAQAAFPQHLPGDPNSRTYVPTFVAFDPASGKLLWQREFPGEMRGGAVITRDSVYPTCWDKNLYRLNRRDGAVVWKFMIGGSAEPVGHGDALYLCLGKTIVCVRER